MCLAQHLKKPKGAKPGQVSGGFVHVPFFVYFSQLSSPVVHLCLSIPQIMVTKELCNVVARPGQSAGSKEQDTAWISKA